MKKSVRFFAIMFNVIFSSVLFFFVLNSILFGLCFPAGKSLFSPEYQILRIHILGSIDSFSERAVSAKIAILDMEGNDCAVIERSWNGNYLFVSFRTAEFDGKTFFFPDRIYGSENQAAKNTAGAEKGGTKLFPYYCEHKQCFLPGGRSSPADRRNMFVLARFAFSPLASVVSGFSGRYTVRLFECETDKDYGIFAGRGGLELRPL